MNVLVVGAGEMGRWVASTLGDEFELAVTDVDRAAAEAAADALGGRAVELATDERFDLVCIAVPMSAASDAIARHAARATDAILDVTGEMAGPVAAMAEHAPDRERVSLHPLFAAENAPGNVAVVADAPGPTTDRVLDRLRADGNTLVETTPAEHDAAMETVQASAHAAVLSFALAAESVPEGLTTPVFEALADVAAQVTGNDPAVYAEIQDAFDGAEAVADAAARVAESRSDSAVDDDSFAALYGEAGTEFCDETDDESTATGSENR